MAAGLLWWLALTQPDGQLHVYFLDVGQGDGIFIQTPSGRQVLIDGGDDGQQLFAELGAVMPFWDRHIDQAIVTHPDWDHIGGQIDLPSRFGIDQAIISENVRSHEDSQLWLAALDGENVPVVGLQQGAWLDLGDGVALWALWPPREEFLTGLEEDDKNERSLVLKLVYGSFAVLLTGDAGLPSEEQSVTRGAASSPRMCSRSGITAASTAAARRLSRRSAQVWRSSRSARRTGTVIRTRRCWRRLAGVWCCAMTGRGASTSGVTDG